MSNRRNRRARHRRHKARTKAWKAITWGRKVTPELHRSIRCRVRFVGGPWDGRLQDLDHDGPFHHVAIWPAIESFEQIKQMAREGSLAVTRVTYRRVRSSPIDVMVYDS